MAENSALEKAPELALDEERQATLFLVGASEKGLQVALDDLVQQGLFGLAPLILDGLCPSRDRGAISRDAIWVPGRPPSIRAWVRHGGEDAMTQKALRRR
jgi:hypothetical protein